MESGGNKKRYFNRALAALVLIAVMFAVYQNCAQQGFVARDEHSGEAIDRETESTPPPEIDLPPPPTPRGSSRVATEADLRVAFIGDQNMTPNVINVLRLIKEQNTDVVIHAGDLAYDDLKPENTPTLWDQMITAELGANFPYLVAIGNHDVGSWKQGRTGGLGYETLLLNRVSRIAGIQCAGEYGINYSCTYKGLHMVLSGVGVRGTGHQAYLDQSLRQSMSMWKICAWHKNQHDMQIGSKPDEVGWQVYEICRQHGAIIATAHQHIYARTHVLSNFENKTVVSTSRTLQLDLGKTFAFVSGISGSTDIRSGVSDDPWWGSAYTSSNGARPGALFCTFNVNGRPDSAHCYFRNIDGQNIDIFDVIAAP